MSALGKADILRCHSDVRFTPESGHVRCSSPCQLWAQKTDIQSRLFDDLVGSGEQRRGYGETERLCCLQVYGEFVFAGVFPRQTSSSLTQQYAINEPRRSSILTSKIRPIGDKTASNNKGPCNVYRGQLVARSCCDDQIDVACPYTTRR